MVHLINLSNPNPEPGSCYHHRLNSPAKAGLSKNPDPPTGHDL